MIRTFLGELLGTCLLVSVGLYSIVASILNAIPLWAVALHWGGTLAVAIILFHRLSGVHLNPAVSLAFLVLKKCTGREFLFMVAGQFLGAALAGLLVLIVMGDQLLLKSELPISARVFAEFYPNRTVHVPMIMSLGVECLGTFLLVLSVLFVAHQRRSFWWAVICVPIVLFGLIWWLAPYTQAGLNPARDLGPRLVAYFTAWKTYAFFNEWNTLLVYMVGPLFGGYLAAMVFKRVERIFRR